MENYEIFICKNYSFELFVFRDFLRSYYRYYNRIISGNVNQVLQVDSVSCNFDTYPYKVNTYARQMIIRESNVTERSLVTRCNLLNSVRSDNNPHGFTIEAFEIIENRDIKVQKR